MDEKNINFTNIGSFNVGTTSFLDSKLQQSMIYVYRMFSIDKDGAGQLSESVKGQTSNINRTSLESIGTTVEPNSTNSFDKIQQEKFTAYLELFNPPKELIDAIDFDIRILKIPAYKVILNIDEGFYSKILVLSNGSKTYSEKYISDADINTFFIDLEQAITAILPSESAN